MHFHNRQKDRSFVCKREDRHTGTPVGRGKYRSREGKHKCKKGAQVGGGAGGGTGAGVWILTQAPWASAPEPERAAELAERGRQLESINQNRRACVQK